MSGPQPVFSGRNNNQMETPPGLRYQTRRMTWGVMGGPLQADVDATGSPVRLWQLVELLRCPVEIWDKYGYAWWGYVDGVTVRLTGTEFGFYLDKMYNRVAVTYSYITPGTQIVGQRKTTAWVNDAASIAMYGTKEYLSSEGGMSNAAAIALRDALLAQFSRPGGIPSLKGRSQGMTATIQCRGWWNTLGWKYARVDPVTAVSYTTTSATEQAVGSANSNSKVMQQVKIGTKSVNVLQLQVYARKQGSPTDNFSLAVYALDGSGNPTGSALASGTAAGSEMSSSLGWVAVTVSEKELAANTLYGLQVSRSGSVDASNYYVVNVNTGLGYADGVFRIYNGSNWAARSPNADMPFQVQVNNNVSITQQIADLITNFGQFFSGVTLESTTTVAQGSYQAGDTNARQVAEDLLKIGGPNGRRLMAHVTRERRVVITEEPAIPTNFPYSVDREGNIYENERRMTEIRPPIGQWVRIREIPGGMAATLTSLDYQFVEGAEWTPGGGLKIAPRGQPSPEEFGRLQ